MESFVSPDDIFMIAVHEEIAGFLVKRVNSESFDVYKEDKLLFSGDDFEVAEFINAEKVLNEEE